MGHNLIRFCIRVATTYKGGSMFVASYKIHDSRVFCVYIEGVARNLRNENKRCVICEIIIRVVCKFVDLKLRYLLTLHGTSLT